MPRQSSHPPRSRAARRIRPISRAAEPISPKFGEFLRVYTNDSRHFFGVKTLPTNASPAGREVVISAIFPQTGNLRRVCTADLTFSKTTTEISDMKKTHSEVGYWKGVPPRLRGHEFLGAILDAAIAESQKRGISQIELTTRNKKLIAYYRKFGFVIIRRWWWGTVRMRYEIK